MVAATGMAPEELSNVLQSPLIQSLASSLPGSEGDSAWLNTVRCQRWRPASHFLHPRAQWAGSSTQRSLPPFLPADMETKPPLNPAPEFLCGPDLESSQEDREREVLPTAWGETWMPAAPTLTPCSCCAGPSSGVPTAIEEKEGREGPA